MTSPLIIPFISPVTSKPQRFNAAVGRLLERLGAVVDPDLVIAVVDGAAVTALSEGRDVHATAADLLGKITAFWAQADQDENSPEGDGPPDDRD